MKKNIAKLAPLIVAVGAQAISSLTNFLFILSLVKILSAEEFGRYSIAFAFLLAGGAIFQGFFQVQMIIQLPGRHTSDQPRFASALFVAQFVAGLVLMVGAYGASRAAQNYGYMVEPYLVTATAAAILGLTGKEFVIRYFFATGQGNVRILTIHLVAAAVIVGLLFCGFSGWDAVLAMNSFACANILAMLAGLLAAPFTLRNLSVAQAVHDIARNGAWASLSALIYSLRSTAHTFIVGATLSFAEAGRMNAARTLVTPVSLLIPTLSSIILPRLSQHFQRNGIAAVLKLTRLIAVAMLVMVLLYSFALYAVWPILQTMILGEEYADMGGIVAVWLIYVLITVLRNTLEWAGQAVRLFSKLSFLNFLSALTALTLVWVMTPIYGVVGAILGACVAEIVMVLGLFFSIIKKKT